MKHDDTAFSTPLLYCPTSLLYKVCEPLPFEHSPPGPWRRVFIGDISPQSIINKSKKKNPAWPVFLGSPACMSPLCILPISHTLYLHWYPAIYNPCSHYLYFILSIAILRQIHCHRTLYPNSIVHCISLYPCVSLAVSSCIPLYLTVSHRLIQIENGIIWQKMNPRGGPSKVPLTQPHADDDARKGEATSQHQQPPQGAANTPFASRSDAGLGLGLGRCKRESRQHALMLVVWH